MAVSPRFHCKMQNPTNKSPNPTRRPMTLDADHGKVCPPHCSASSKQQMDPMKRIVPRKSMRCILILNGRALLAVSAVLICKKRDSPTNTANPIGTFLDLLRTQLIWSLSGYLHPETPSPIYSISQNTSNDWSNGHGNAKDTDHNAHKQWSSLKLNRMGNDAQGSLKASCSAQASNCSAKNENQRARCSSTDN